MMRKQPNIVLVMADQYVPMLSSLGGCAAAQTPTLDRLAREGVTFDAAYCNYPVCSPSRASLLTGQYASQVGCFDNASLLASDIPTIAHYLTLAGYDTALAGKMHFIGPDQLHGFAKRLTTDVFPSSLAWLPSRDGPARFVHPNNPEGPPIAIDYVTAGPVQWNEQLQYDEDVHSRALEFLRARCQVPGGSLQMPPRSPNTQPFFLCVSYHHPHEPFQPPQRYWDSFAEADVPLPSPSEGQPTSVMDEWVNTLHGVDAVDMTDTAALTKMRRAYLALQAYVDDKLGELVGALDDAGLRDDTVVIFTSDHGDMLGERGMVQKRVFYEWSARVPLVFWAADGLARGARIDEPVSLIDLFPTVSALAGVERHDGAGQSLLPALHGEQLTHAPVFVEYHSEGVYAPCFMVRDGDFKYTYIHGVGEQLFNVHADPSEEHDLAGLGEYAETVKVLREAIFDQFDPDEIERRIRRGLSARGIVREANRRAATQWDYFPDQDSFTSYWRG